MNNEYNGMNNNQNGYNDMNNGYVPINYNQPMNNNYITKNVQTMGNYQMNNNYQEPKKKSKIGLIIIIIIVVLLAIVYVPIMFVKAPIGTWECDSSTYKDITFTSKDFIMTLSVNGYTGTMSAKYSKSYSLNSPKEKKSGYTYVTYRVKDASVTASGQSADLDTKNNGFILGMSKDGKTIHYVAGTDENALNFICTKR